MAQNIYDNEEFFEGYSRLSRSVEGLDGAAEWPALRALLTFTGSAVAWLRDCLENLEVDGERMRANLGDRDPSAGAASELIDRALRAHRDRRVIVR